MTKDYIRINRKAYDSLALEYLTRDYVMADDFYLNNIFNDTNFEAGQKILEIGPGRGARLKNFCDFNLDVTAIELSKEMVNLCNKIAPTVNIINKNVLECDFDTKFDYIYMEAIIHNFPLEDAKKVIDLVYKWLKEDGLLICATTLHDNDYEGYESKNDYDNKEKRFRHRYTKESFDNLFKNKFKVVNKKYFNEKDEKRNKIWQVIYLKK